MEKLAGIIFSRYYMSTNPETNEQAESIEFLGRLLEGKLLVKEEEYLKPYLQPLWEINRSIRLLNDDK